jgi:hypothetical protein
MPLYSIHYSSFEIEGQPVEQRSAAPSSDVAHVTPDFLATMNIPLIEGRVFTEQEAEQDPPAVAVVNQSLARRYWPKGDAVGSHIRELPLGRAPGPWQTVIGIVGDFRQNSVETPPRPELMWPARAYRQMTVVLQTANSNPSSIASRLEQAVWNIDREQAVAEVQPVEQAIADNNSQRRFNMLAIRSFACFSMLLTLVGLFGLISSLIASRFRDIAIRLALGAQRTQICLLQHAFDTGGTFRPDFFSHRIALSGHRNSPGAGRTTYADLPFAASNRFNPDFSGHYTRPSALLFGQATYRRDPVPDKPA